MEAETLGRPDFTHCPLQSCPLNPHSQWAGAPLGTVTPGVLQSVVGLVS